jgi:hypothetical protein
MGEVNKSIRLSTTPGGTDKHLNIKLEQNFDFLEVLSLKISQQDLYNTFCANYGVVIGRVLANKGFGVPNAKVSIFIPITDEDETNELIQDLYPYKTITDKNKDGYRYNLLIDQVTCDLNKPTGTFPNKQKLLNNDVWVEVYDKYYKYTTKTNESGDFMIFGVPVGERTIHMDVDLSDAGILSIRPYDLISQGATLNSFESSTKFKTSSNLDSLVQIKSSDQSVDVIPFWGNPETCEIGITRLDIDTNVELEPTALFMGSIFSDKEKQSLNKRCNPRNGMGELDELRTGSGTIDFIRAKKINPVEWVQNRNVEAIELESFSIKDGDLIDDDGTFAITLPMNVGRVITNEIGELVPSPDPNVGLPTKALYRMKMKFNEPPQNRKRRTANMIFPSLSSDHGGTEGYSSSGLVADIGGTEDQRFTDNILDYKDPDKDFHLFEWKQVYTIAQYIKKYKKGPNRFSFLGLKNNDKEGAANNPLPFNTAVRKADFLFALGSFFFKIGAFLLKFLIILIGLEFGFYFGLRLSVLGADIIKFYKIIRIAPFAWIGDILPEFCGDPDDTFCCEQSGNDPDARGFSLSCGDTTFCIRTDQNLCGTGGGPDCCNDSNCGGGSVVTISDASGCGGSSCNEPVLCLRPYFFLPSESNCQALDTLDTWRCCNILELAEKRNVIRRSFFDAWIIGTSYLFQYKYKSKQKVKNGEIIKKEKFCGPGSDTKGSNNYHLNKCCPHDNAPNNECAKCLIRGENTSDKPISKIEDYHRDWHNDTVIGNCGGLLCGNGATDIRDNIYCNAYNSTKIVSLGRIEMCLDTLNEIEKCINATNCVLDMYKQVPEFYTGTFYEDGWDPNFWVNEMGATSYQDPLEVIRYLLSFNNCRISAMFRGASGCHDKELKDEYYQWVKEISKIYNEIVVGQTDPNTDLDQFEPGISLITSVDNGVVTYEEDEDGIINSGYVFDNRLGQRFSPCGKGNSNPECNQPPLTWSGEDKQTIDFGPGSTHNSSRNIPYYYFGLTPGKTAIDKLRKQFFVN